MSPFDVLPNELLQHILSYDDLGILNVNLVSKRFYDNVKHVKVAKLKPTTSLDDIERLSKIYKVSVDLSGKNITDTDLYKLRNVHTLNLRNTKIKDVSALSKVHILDLSDTNVTDVSMLGNVHTLDLSFTDVKNVSALNNVHTLYLSYTKVKDVSSLENVHTLYLDGCVGLIDVSSLGNVHTLYLDG